MLADLGRLLKLSTTGTGGFVEMNGNMLALHIIQ